MFFREIPTFNPFFVLATSAYCGVIFFLSAQSTLSLPQFFSWQDKIEHAVTYFVLGILARKAVPFASFWMILLFVFLYGLSDEIHQYFVPGRFCDILDFVADASGGTIALILHHYLIRGKALRNRRKRGAF